MALWLSYEFVALLEALFAGYLFAYFGWGYDSQGNLVNLNQLYAAEGGEQVRFPRQFGLTQVSMIDLSSCRQNSVCLQPAWPLVVEPHI